VTLSAPEASLVELPHALRGDAVEVFVSAYRRDAEFAQAFWDGEPAPADALFRIFRAAYAQQVLLHPPLAIVDRGVVVAVANHVLPSRRGSLNPAFHLSAHLAGLALLLLPWGVRRRMPSEQGRGHARTLLEAIRERSRSDPLSTGVAISTYSESNVRLYERLGFEVTGQSRRDSTPVWALFAAH